MLSTNLFSFSLRTLAIALICGCTYAMPTGEDYHETSYPTDGENYSDTDYYAEMADTNDPNIYQCPGGQLGVPTEQLCDGHPDCVDRSDEDPVVCKKYCRETIEHVAAVYVKPPIVIPTDELHMMYEDYEECGGDSSEFKCTSSPGLCIPIYSKCDGISDCPEGEDELSCDATTTTVPNTPFSDGNGFDTADDNMGLRMSISAKTTDPKASIHRTKSEIIVESSSGDIVKLSRTSTKLDKIPKSVSSDSLSSTASSMVGSNLVTESNLFLPKLLIHAQRPRVKKLVEVHESNRGNAALHQSIRHASGSEKVRDTPLQSYAGESGETYLPKKIQRRLQAMSDEEAERFLQDYARLTSDVTSQEETEVSPPMQQQRGLTSDDAEQTMALTTTPRPEPLSSTSTHTKKSKKSNGRKKKVKGLLHKLLRQMGKLVSSDVDAFDMDVSIQLREIPKRKTGSNDSADLADSNRPKRRRKPKVNVHLKMSL